VHNVNNVYSWAGCCSAGGCNYPCQPNAEAAATCQALTGGVGSGVSLCQLCVGSTCNVDPDNQGALTTVWDWINQVNLTNFAGHNDWRLPSEDACTSCYSSTSGSCTSCSPHELETILLAPYLCGTTPCIDPIFGPTESGLYWAASTIPYRAPSVSFLNGYVFISPWQEGLDVRAVRGGP
jgi:hypothetical protein